MHTGSGDPTRAALPAHVRAKIVTRDQLLAARTQARRGGRALVQCHGCFDIVHPGHIRHLRQARSLGDLLLVSITGDPGINKGLGRPLIPEELRAENLAALDCVDFVYIDDQPTALSLLQAVQPDIYVKGKEYESNNDPRFAAERAAVEQSGGRVVFSSGDVVFSSTALIAALEHSADPYHQRLTQLCQRDELSGPTLYSLISGFRNKKVLVVGETIIDTYILCDRPEVASESPVMTLRPLEARHYDGGAAIVARHLAALGARPTLVTTLPATRDGQALRERLEAEGIEVRPTAVKTPVPEKQRYLVGAQKVMKVDLVEPLVLDAAAQDRFTASTVELAAVGGHEAAIITDFGLGLFAPKMMARLCKGLRPHVRTLAGDVSGKRSNLRFMRDMDLLCPSEQELREVMRLHGEGLPLVAYRLLDATQSRAAMVTLGADGLIAFSPIDTAHALDDPTAWTTRLHSDHIPALCPIALDPLGCGDSLLSIATLTLAAGGSLLQAGFLGACAAAVQVQRLGNTPVTPADLRQTIARVQSSKLVFTGDQSSKLKSQTSNPIQDLGMAVAG